MSPNGGAPSHEAQATHAEDIRSVKELAIKQAAEIDTLKEEMRALQRQLTETGGETRNTTKQKSPSPLRKPVP
jgi:hypothetical protein